MRTPLLTLPNELLLAIFEDVPTSILFAFATSCNRLRIVFLASYIRRSGLADPEDRCIASISSNTRGHDLITALFLYPMMTKTRYFQCTFPTNKIPLKTMLHHFDRVERLISSLTSVEEVVLKFTDSKEHHGTFTNRDIDAWSDSIGRLFNSIIERGCNSLQVSGLRQMTLVYKGSYRLPKPPSKPLFTPLEAVYRQVPKKSDFNVLLGKNWNHRQVNEDPVNPPPILPKISPQAQSQSRLTHFTIGSESLLTPPLLQWTYSVLSTSPITTVVIRDIIYHGPTWHIASTILPQAIPGLKRLQFVKVGSFSQGSLCLFLNSFPNLEYLSVEDPRMVKPRKPDGTIHNILKLTYSHLTELRVTQSWLDPVFDFTKESMPALKSFTIIIPEGTVLWNISQPTLAYLLLEKLWNRGPDLHFDVNLALVTNRDDIVSWMQNPQNQPGPWQTGGKNTIPWIQCVTGVGLTIKYQLILGDEKKTKACAEDWFGRFPGLRRVNVRSDVKDSGSVEDSIERFCQIAALTKFWEKLAVEVNGKVWIGSVSTV